MMVRWGRDEGESRGEKRVRGEARWVRGGWEEGGIRVRIGVRRGWEVGRDG